MPCFSKSLPDDFSLFFFKSFCVFLLAVPGLCCCIGFSLVVWHNGYSLVMVLGLLIAMASLAAPWALGHKGFSGGGPKGSVVVVPQL